MKRTIFQNLHYILGVLWMKERKVFFTMLLHIVEGAIVPFVGILIPSLIISLLLENTSVPTFLLYVGVLLMVYGILQGSLSYLKEYNDFSFLHLRGTYFIRECYLSRLHLDYDVLEDSDMQKQLEEAQNGVRSNTEGVEAMFHHFIEFAMALLGLLTYALISGGLSILLVIMLLVLVLLQYASFQIARKHEEKNRRTLQGYLVQSYYLNNLAYNLPAGKDIRLYQLQDWITQKFKRVVACITNIRKRDYRAYMISDCVSLLLDFFRDIACYGFLIYQLTQGLPVEQFVFYLGVITGFSIWFKKIGEEYAILSIENTKVNSFLDALQIPNKMNYGTGKKIEGNDICITFDHVYFSYPKYDRNILEDVSFCIKAHEKVALVGVNGAGKSTIVKLILGFYVPTSGSVKINGIDTRELDYKQVYAKICGLFQDALLLSYSIMENVSMETMENSDKALVQQCLQDVGLWDFIQSLPQKEKTYIFKDIDCNGIQLSGGQIQHLLLARALYRNPNALLLDEPTAALDAIAEKNMYEAYGRIAHKKTCIFISHRLSSTRFCDRILVLKDGRMIEEGTHEQLLTQLGIYWEMFKAQSKYYEEGCETYEDLS